jgi:hypothetical protein
MAKTGNTAPNISTTFMGKSTPEEEKCKQIPRSLAANSFG